jgi:hypothetical protein
VAARQEIAQEREYRASQKRERERVARKPYGSSLQVVSQKTNTGGGLRPPAPPVVCTSNSLAREQKETPTCEGLNLSSHREVHANKALPDGKREIGILTAAELERQKQFILQKYGKPGNGAGIPPELRPAEVSA